MVIVTATMVFLDLLVQPCVAQRAVATGAAVNWAPVSATRDLMVKVVISAKRTCMDRFVTSFVSGRLCAMITAAVAITVPVIATMGTTVQVVSGSARLCSNATVMGVATHAVFATAQTDFMALHARCTAGRIHARGMVSALMMVNVTAMMAIMERRVSGSAEIPRRAAAMATATWPANAFVAQVSQVFTAITAAQITTGRHVTCTATVSLCVTITVDAVQMRRVTVMKATSEKLAVSSATPLRRARAEGSVM
eukprot:COSAG02_NODE_13647_length_1367_cov_1.300473_1_plen_252_part_00